MKNIKKIIVSLLNLILFTFLLISLTLLFFKGFRLNDNMITGIIIIISFTILSAFLLEIILYREIVFQRKKINTYLLLSEKEFAVPIYSTGDAVISTDQNGLITQLNPHAERLTGWKQSEAEGHSIDEVFILSKENPAI